MRSLWRRNRRSAARKSAIAITRSSGIASSAGSGLAARLDFAIGSRLIMTREPADIDVPSYCEIKTGSGRAFRLLRRGACRKRWPGGLREVSDVAREVSRTTRYINE